MNILDPPRIVVLGFLSHFPVAGVAWQTIHYLVGLQRLGFDVYYVEAHGCSPTKLMESDTDDGPARAAAYISRIMTRFDLSDRWAYHALYEGRYFGLTRLQLGDLYRSATMILNLHGSHLPRPELTASNRLVYLETDPVDVEIDLFQHNPATLDYLSPHCAFFTFGENVGKPDCLVPAPARFQFLPTRQPVVLDLWNKTGGDRGTTFTTIGNWKQPWREITYKGEVYRWSKHFEFQKFLTLPQRVAQRFELALSSYDDSDRQLLESHGWQVRPALDFSRDLDLYAAYIAESRAEFTVAKDQNIRLRSGWFSDRAATYLAAGRPVVTQETGFSNILPTGEGLLAFSNLEDSIQAIQAVNSDYPHHSRAAQDIAKEFFSHDVVLGRLLSDIGISCPIKRNAACKITEKNHPLSPSLSSKGEKRSSVEIQKTEGCDAVPSLLLRGEGQGEGSVSQRNELPPVEDAPSQGLPDDLVLRPISRWPTRLEEATFQTALSLPIPSPRILDVSPSEHASIIILVRNGLAYTKMCIASLFEAGWYLGDELIIVDNASTDGTGEYLSELSRNHEFVRIVSNPDNVGFAAGNNQGLALATGGVLILLNNDTLVSPGWREGLIRWLGEPQVGIVGPVTNRTCNEAQIEAPCLTYGEFKQFATDYSHAHQGEANEISMLAMFCVAMRSELFKTVGPLDEDYEIGMFEDDDYAQRVRAAGYRLLCAEDVFVHHFGQASLGELCTSGEYDSVLETNRRRFEEKWGREWKPHGRRLTPQYARLRERIRETAAQLPPKAIIVVVSKGDNELLKLNGHRAWHFPQDNNGEYANIYPAEATEAIAHLETLRANGANFLLIPKPAFWWLSYYSGFRDYLDRNCRLAVKDEETCLIYDLGGGHG
jgi:GT2 family glycosyltransferase